MYSLTSDLSTHGKYILCQSQEWLSAVFFLLKYCLNFLPRHIFEGSLFRNFSWQTWSGGHVIATMWLCDCIWTLRKICAVPNHRKWYDVIGKSSWVNLWSPTSRLVATREIPCEKLYSYYVHHQMYPSASFVLSLKLPLTCINTG